MLDLHKSSPELSGEQICQHPQKSAGIICVYDWIEFTGEIGKTDLLTLSNSCYTIAKSERGSQHFRDLYNVKTDVYGEALDVCTIETNPRVSYINDSLCRVKLHNRFCYRGGLSSLIRHLCEVYNIKFKHFTRIDYAIDFQQVNRYGSEIQQLLENFASGKLVVKGKGYKLHRTRTSITGVTWGSRASGLSVTCYNKTVEMAKKTSKPWIELMWRSAGFDMEKDTYRLEFSTKRPRYSIVTEEGETYGSYADIDFLEGMQKHLEFLYTRFFQVAFLSPGTRFSRCERYYMFDLGNASEYYPQAICVKPQSSNIKKTIIKNIVLEAAWMQREGKRVEASYAWELAMQYVERYSLEKWWKKTYENCPGIEKSYLTHYDMVNMESLKKHHIKSVKLPNIPLWN